jgi:hypothetical protein
VFFAILFAQPVKITLSIVLFVEEIESIHHTAPVLMRPKKIINQKIVSFVIFNAPPAKLHQIIASLVKEIV